MYRLKDHGGSLSKCNRDYFWTGNRKWFEGDVLLVIDVSFQSLTLNMYSSPIYVIRNMSDS